MSTPLNRRRIPLRRQFRLRLELPNVSPDFRSLDFSLMLPGVFVRYLENAPCHYSPYRAESGAQIGVFNPFTEFDLGAEIAALPSFRDTVRVRYVGSYIDRRWHEVPDGWTGRWEVVDGREEPVLG